ncbi:trigger factor [Lichenibacterium dinghuense]|uniref:trigger factor n=1 Tax=Lichenibacterium dinghuense TaxID=2895977 RepID=UPI001F02E6D3|nr:trigger factor [Lichenibacterium sp. 6Y81]
MQVTEISASGLKREYKVVLPAADLASRLQGELVGMKDKVRINGFRPGKVPLSHLKRLYGRSIMGDVVQNAVNEANRKIVEDNNLRLALEPKIDLASDQAEVERAMEAEGDLSFTVAVETIPAFETGSFEDLELERQVAEISDDEIQRSVDSLAQGSRSYTPREGDDAVAASGDRLKIDFEGRIDDVPFEGGKGEDAPLVLGSNTFIPGFEDQLVGAKAGEERRITVTFPADYNAAQLAGKEATFDVKVREVGAPGEQKLDDDFAKTFGFDTFEALRDAIRSRMQEDFSRASRDRIKRSLLDALDKRYSFELPEGLVGQEFDNIWRQVGAEQGRTGKTFADEDTTEEAARAEYRRIAERRVRLGLVLAEVGEKAGIKVEDAEVGKALVELTRQYPGQEKAVWEHYTKNPQALSEIKAPLFEEKVVDHIVGQAKVTERTVSRDELFKPQDDEDGAPKSVPGIEQAGAEQPSEG